MNAADVMREHAITLDDLARVTGYSAHSCRKYVYGEREMRQAHEHELVEEYGAPGRVLAEAMRTKRREYLATHPLAPANGRNGKRLAITKPLRVKAREKRGVWKPIANPADDDWDGKLYPIDEWKRLFGEPGSSQGASGRVEGYFPSEPCFMGE